jgi:uncharacterized damage-inducible protein DinB
MMIARNLDTKDFFASYLTTCTKFLEVVCEFSEEEFNVHQDAGGWTAGQVVEHVTRSTRSIVQAIKASGNIVQREPDERVDEFKKLFLDFSVKFNSPKFALPTLELHEKKKSVNELNIYFLELGEAAKKANLYEAVNDPALGEMTKWELLYVALYHTQRHIWQLVNSYTNLQTKKKQDK